MVGSLKRQFTFENISQRRGVDLHLLVLVILLAGIGAVSLFSASWFFSMKVDKGPYYFFHRHLQFLLIGTFLAIVITYLNIEIFNRTASLLLLLSIVLNVLVFIPGVGQTISGGTRWFQIAGVKFQPSEVIKITLTLYLAKQFDKKRGIINDFLRTILPALIVVGISSWIIVSQNDFSTSFFVLILSVVLLFTSGVKKRYLAIISGFFISVGVVVILIQPYRIKRIISWLDPSKDPLAGGYQILASLRALSSGGFIGKGIGAGQIKLGPLPQAHSDFVFTIVGEEAGLLGVGIVILLFLLFFLKGLSIASKQDTRFKVFIASGFSSAIFFQAILNMGVVCGLFPPTGIPLPFFSAGGTSLIVTMIMIGFLCNLSRIQVDNDEE